jgi:hypothetical protein
MLFGKEHTERYRATGGDEGHDWRGTQTLLLTTTGRRRVSTTSTGHRRSWSSTTEHFLPTLTASACGHDHPSAARAATTTTLGINEDPSTSENKNL